MGIERSGLLFEIDPKLSGANPIVGLPVAMKTPQVLVGIIELLLGESADDLDEEHLRACIKLVKLIHALFAEINLKHGRGRGRLICKNHT